MISRIFQQTLRISLLLLVVVHVVLLATVAIEKMSLARARHHYDANVSMLPDPRPAGFTEAGTPLEFDKTGSGFAVRFASNNCPYTRKDEQWGVLSHALQARGIPISVLLPTPKHAFPAWSLMPSGVQQIAYIDTDWIQRYHLSVTPTLLVFDSERRIVWHREGTLSSADAISALQVVDALKMHR